VACGNCRESQCLLSLVRSEEGRCVQVMPGTQFSAAAADWGQVLDVNTGAFFGGFMQSLDSECAADKYK